MKHPIYRHRNIVKLLNKMASFEREEKLMLFCSHIKILMMKENSSIEEANSFANRLLAYLNISKNGHILVNMKNANEWDEEASKKSIEKMRCSDLKSPYIAYMIDLRGAEWCDKDFCSIHMDNDVFGIDFERDDNDKKGGIYHASVTLELDSNKTIKEAVENLKVFQELKDFVYKILSLNLYLLMFKKDNNRVEVTKVVNNASKRKNIPKHTTNKIYLSQPTYKLKGTKRNDVGSKHKHAYLVKGHFRNQPIGKRGEGKFKTIWINQIWKGEGSKELMKEIIIGG